MKDSWNKFNYYSPFVITERLASQGRKKLITKGTAISETITRNGIKYTAEELSKSAKTLENKPILKDHKNEIDSIVGKVVNSPFNTTKVEFSAEIFNPTIVQMLEDGLINNVSIGAKVSDLIEEKIGDSVVRKAIGLEFLELSLVAVPGDPNAIINHDYTAVVSESFDIKNKEIMVEVKPKMVEESIAKLSILEQENRELKERLNKIEASEKETQLVDKIVEKIISKMTPSKTEEVKVEVKEETKPEIEEEVKPKTKGIIGEKMIEKPKYADVNVFKNDEYSLLKEGLSVSAKTDKFGNFIRGE